MNKPWKLIVLLVGIFLAGGATGALVGLRMARGMMQNRPPPAPELWTKLHLKRMADEIGLQPGQMEQIRPVVARGMGELFAMRGQFLADNRARRVKMEQEVMALLLPEQRPKYEKINREFQERARKLERGGRRLPGSPESPRGDHDDDRPPRPDRPGDR